MATGLEVEQLNGGSPKLFLLQPLPHLSKGVTFTILQEMCEYKLTMGFAIKSFVEKNSSSFYFLAFFSIIVKAGVISNLMILKAPVSSRKLNTQFNSSLINSGYAGV